MVPISFLFVYNLAFYSLLGLGYPAKQKDMLEVKEKPQIGDVLSEAALPCVRDGAKPSDLTWLGGHQD